MSEDFRCACVPNAEHTAIVRACQLHEAWAKATWLSHGTQAVADAEVARTMARITAAAKAPR